MIDARTAKQIIWVANMLECVSKEDVEWVIYMTAGTSAFGPNPFLRTDPRHDWFNASVKEEFGHVVRSERYIAHCERN